MKDYLNSNQKVTVVLALGVNDMGNLPYYISYYQDLMKKYPKTTFYVMGVGPVDEKTEEKHGIINMWERLPLEKGGDAYEFCYI